MDDLIKTQNTPSEAKQTSETNISDVSGNQSTPSPMETNLEGSVAGAPVLAITSGPGEDRPMETEVAAAATQIRSLTLTKTKRMSGAQRRKRRVQAAVAAGLPVQQRRPRHRRGASGRGNLPPETPAPSPHTPGTSNPSKGTKRPRGNRSEESTPSSSDGGARFPKMRAVGGSQNPPSRQGVVSNRPKVYSQKPAYSEVASELRMAIVPATYPTEKFTDEQTELVQDALMDRLIAMSGDAAKELKFSNSYGRRGVLFITPLTEVGKQWLIDVVPGLTPWEGAVLRAGNAKEIVKTTKMLVWVPSPLNKREDASILHLIQLQNEELKTSEWGIISSRPEPLGKTLVLEIDETSLKAMERTGFNIQAGLFTLTFKVLGVQRSRPNVASQATKPAAQ